MEWKNQKATELFEFHLSIKATYDIIINYRCIYERFLIKPFSVIITRKKQLILKK